MNNKTRGISFEIGIEAEHVFGVLCLSVCYSQPIEVVSPTVCTLSRT